MFKSKKWGLAVSGLCAGIVNGLFGSGGGMVLIPLLTILATMQEEEIFPSSVGIILPICIISLTLYLRDSHYPIREAVPYLIGSFLGGILAWKFGRKIPTKWLHRLLGIFILWGGVRYLC